MISPIRKRCPKCKGVYIYKRKPLKNMISKSGFKRTVRHVPPSHLYHCYLCGHEFDVPFVGTKQ